MLTGEGTVKQLQDKGFKAVKAPEGIVNAAARYGVQTPAQVLSADEMSGPIINRPERFGTSGRRFRLDNNR